MTEFDVRKIMFVRRREYFISIMIVIVIVGNLYILFIHELPNQKATSKRMGISDEPLTIVFDMSHGQYKESVFIYQDTWLAGNLTNLGYNVIWAWGGLNDTILEDATGLVIGAISGITKGFTAAEYTAFDNWFNSGERFLWIAADSDFGRYAYINANASAMLEITGSHVYPEPSAVEDPIYNCNASYRVVANRTGDSVFVSPMVEGVSGVLMHGPTLLYGSNSTSNPGGSVEPVSLESITIENVYPLLYYSETAVIIDSDLISPLAHYDSQIRSFVCAKIETHLGVTNSNIVVVSGASPYGDYMPMSVFYYYDRILEGDKFVIQVIDHGVKLLGVSTITSPGDMVYEEGVIGNVIEWQAFDPHPKSYNISSKDVLLKDGLWNSSNEIISIMVDGLSAGTYNYTLQVYNEDNNCTSDSVIVTVQNPNPPTINHPRDITYYEGNNESKIVWIPNDLSLYYYEIFKNGELILTHYWFPDESHWCRSLLASFQLVPSITPFVCMIRFC